MIRFAVLLLLAALLPAADQPQQLDPNKPADAVLIVDGLTRQLALPREQAVALTIAIQTLAKLERAAAEMNAHNEEIGKQLKEMRASLDQAKLITAPAAADPAKPKE